MILISFNIKNYIVQIIIVESIKGSSWINQKKKKIIAKRASHFMGTIIVNFEVSEKPSFFL